MKQFSEYTDTTFLAINATTVSGATIASQFFDYFTLFAILIVANILDFFLGVMASYRCNEDVTSRKAKLGALSKLVVIIVAGFFSLVLTMFYGHKASGVITWYLWVFMFSELLSIAGNFEALRTGERKKEQDVIVLMIRAGRKKIAKLLSLDEQKGS